MINIQKFIFDEEYRTKEAYPYIQSILRKNWNALWKEMQESKDLTLNLYKLSKGQSLTESEIEASLAQLKDIAKIIPAIGIFLLPGGIFILAILGKLLPWDLVPSAFKEELEIKSSNGGESKK
ncbi:MAG TPA: LETM1 domain-containing protein [bacterium]|nr:LETM1 domain-containing protein [bacterium]HPN29910.1 LETM1 domain-containing protein [bacterium]